MITAAGAGTRLGARKQFIELAPAERLVDRTVTTARSVADWVGLLLPGDVTWDGDPVDALGSGGGSRYDTVERGLSLIPPDIEIVLVHSASHPLATEALARRLIEAVRAGADGAVPFLPAVDVVKRCTDDGVLATVGREGLGSAQCPMAFSRSMLDRAFAETETGTEESAVVEAVGGRVVAVDGEVGNIHVVDRPSLAVARHLADLVYPGESDQV